MKIAFLTSMLTSPDKPGGYVHVTQVANRLLDHGHRLYTNLLNESESFIRHSEDEFFKKGHEIDAFYIRLHGSTWNDELTHFRHANPDAPCIWEINAPLEEMRTRGISEEEIRKGNERRKTLATMVDAAVCVSDEMEEYAKNELGMKRTFVVPNGSDPLLFTPEKKDANIFGDVEFKVMWIGSPEFAWQGLRIVEKVADKLKEIDKSILIIATAEGKSTNNIAYIGRIPYSEIPKYIASADLGLCIYEHIDFYKEFFFSPLKLYDYMASGIPVVGSDVGQIKYVIEKHENGLLTDTTVDDIIEKIIFLKKNRELSAQMGANGRNAVISIYNWDRVVLQIENIIAELLRQKGHLKNPLTGDKKSKIDVKKHAEYDADQLKRLLDEATDKVKQRDMLISDIYNSYSWRITSPLRVIYRLIFGKR